MGPDFKHCIVICGGEGKRTEKRFVLKWDNIRDLKSLKLFSNLRRKPKPLFKIWDIPVIFWVIDFWKNYTEDFIFITGYKKEKLDEYIKKLEIDSSIIEDNELTGLANALNMSKDHVKGKFIVALGDCICKGKFNFPENMEVGFGVFETNKEEDIKRSYSVEVKDGLAKKVVEKPKELVNNLCGMGFYFFDERVFKYIEKTEPSERTARVELTDVIQTMIDAGEKVTPVIFEGEYLNITYPEDIEMAKKILPEI